MSSDNEDAQFQAYKDDPRISCQYGVKCYQRNPQHHSKYKHPPKTNKQKTEKIITGAKRKRDVKVGQLKKARSESPQRKLQNLPESSERNLHNLSPSPERDSDVGDEEKNGSEKGFTTKTEADENTTLDQHKHSSDPTECDNGAAVSDTDVVQKIIMDLFLVKMPRDFFQFYEFCKSVSKDNPLTACKSVRLKLVGPYDVLDGKIKGSESEDDKERYLTHWRYYYDPPEFQTVIKCDDKEGLHFGYWRDDVTEKPVFVARNRANVNCVFEPVAENLFGAIDAYVHEKAKLSNPFERAAVTRLHTQLRNFAKQRDITLERQTASTRARERSVVARTFHRAGVVVPYDKKTQLGYRNLAVTDNDLQKILKRIKECDTTEERKTPMAKLDEVIRLATIAADECDFGTCLELGHDLFADGDVHVQTRALQMLRIAYTYLKRSQLLKIVEAHLKDRKKGCELAAI